MSAENGSGAGSKLRVLVASFGSPGHAFPALALALELRWRGHAVAFESWKKWRPHARDAGIEFAPAPEYRVFPSRGKALKPYAAAVRAAHTSRRLIHRFAPDIVVADILTLAPALAADLEGIPRATIVPHLYPLSEPGWGPFGLGARPPRTRPGRAIMGALGRAAHKGFERGRDELNESRRRLGLPPQDRILGGMSDSLVLLAVLPHLEYPRKWAPHIHLVGPLTWEPPAPVSPAAFEAGGTLPSVLVATSTSHPWASAKLARLCLKALGGTDVSLTVVGKPSPGEAAAGFGSNVRIVPWISYSQAMRQADLVICNAGTGTIAHALAVGTPIVAIPGPGDMLENSARLAWSGAGVRLVPPFATGRRLRAAVQRALGDPRYRRRAEEIEGWLSAAAPESAAADLVERAVAGEAKESSRIPQDGYTRAIARCR